MGYSHPAVVGVLEVPWPVGSQATDGGLVVLLADLWGDAMYAKIQSSTTSAASAVPVPISAGPTVSLANLNWARLKRRWTMMGLILILRPFCQRRPGLESPRRLPGVHQQPPPQPPHPSSSPQSSHQDPNLRPRLEENGRGVQGQLSKPRELVRQVGLTPTPQESRGGPFVWAIPYLSDGVTAVGLGSTRTCRAAPKRRHPVGVSGGPARKAASHPQSKQHD